MNQMRLEIKGTVFKDTEEVMINICDLNLFPLSLMFSVTTLSLQIKVDFQYRYSVDTM